MTEAILKLLAEHPDWKLTINSHNEYAIMLKIVAPLDDGGVCDMIRMVSMLEINRYKGGDLLGINLRELQIMMERDIERTINESQKQS